MNDDEKVLSYHPGYIILEKLEQPDATYYRLVKEEDITFAQVTNDGQVLIARREDGEDTRHS